MNESNSIGGDKFTASREQYGSSSQAACNRFKEKEIKVSL